MPQKTWSFVQVGSAAPPSRYTAARPKSSAFAAPRMLARAAPRVKTPPPRVSFLRVAHCAGATRSGTMYTSSSLPSLMFQQPSRSPTSVKRVPFLSLPSVLRSCPQPLS